MDGGFSTHVLATASQAVRLSPAVDPAFAAISCCSGITTFAAIRKLGHIDKRDKILFIGAGGLGLMALQLFKVLHPDHPGPVVADIDQAKLDHAKAAGASDILNLKTSHKELERLAKSGNAPHSHTSHPFLFSHVLFSFFVLVASWVGDGFSGILDFVGAGPTLSQAVTLLSKGGKLVVVGLLGGTGHIPVPFFPLKDIQVVGNYLGTAEEFRVRLLPLPSNFLSPLTPPYSFVDRS